MACVPVFYPHSAAYQQCWLNEKSSGISVCGPQLVALFGEVRQPRWREYITAVGFGNRCLRVCFPE